MRGAITEQLDATQLLVAAFFLFFAGLVFYLRREDKREGYPMHDITPVGVPIEGFPPAPPPKEYKLLEGGTTAMPHHEPPSRMAGAPLLRFSGAPLIPIGDPMHAEIGPGAFPLRKDEPFQSFGHPQVLPLREAKDWHLAEGDPDPRQLPVFDARHEAVGVIHDLWVDRGVRVLRYLEVELDPPAEGNRQVLVPIYYADINRRRRFVRVRALLAHELRRIPRLTELDQISALEEDRVNAYFASAALFGRGRQGGLMLSDTEAARWLQ